MLCYKKIIMLKRYEQFLNDFDNKLAEYTNNQRQYIKCQKGCIDCCEIGEYPFSRLEAEYLMRGFLALPNETKKIIKNNISKLLEEKRLSKKERFTYRCPFLINGLCSVYKYRGLTCRVFGLAYLDNGVIKLPECANFGLNYSNVYDKQTKTINLSNPIQEPLKIDTILRSPLAESYELECGEIRPLINWFS